MLWWRDVLEFQEDYVDRTFVVLILVEEFLDNEAVGVSLQWVPLGQDQGLVLQGFEKKIELYGIRNIGFVMNDLFEEVPKVGPLFMFSTESWELDRGQFELRARCPS